jgi:hypothetical protein
MRSVAPLPDAGNVSGRSFRAGGVLFADAPGAAPIEKTFSEVYGRSEVHKMAASFADTLLEAGFGSLFDLGCLIL